MVIGGNGAVILFPILLTIFTLLWCVTGGRDKVKILLCSFNLLLVALIFLQIFFKVIPVNGEPIVVSLIAVSISMIISPLGVFIYGKYKNT